MVNLVVAVTFWLLPMLTALACLRLRTPAEHSGEEPQMPRPTAPSIGLWVLVAGPSLAQFGIPGLERWLRRDWALIEQGQVWRLITSVIVQDGGVVGTVFNLVILALVLLAAQVTWAAARTWIVFWVGGLVANLVVGPSLNPVGAGNSMATFVLAVALATTVVRERPPAGVRKLAAGALACMLLMLLAGNYHGVAALVGVPLAVLVGPRGIQTRGRPGRV